MEPPSHNSMGERMRLRARTKLALLAVLALAVVALTASAGTATGASAASAVPRAGTGSPQTGEFTPSGTTDATDEEFAGEGENAEEGPDPFNGSISLSGTGGSGQGASANSGKNAKSNPELNMSFEGLNHYQQRYSRGGNQFS